MRIAYLSADLGVPIDSCKGAAAHLRGLARALTAVGHEVLVLAPGPRNGDVPQVPFAALPVPQLTHALGGAVPRKLARALGHLWNNVATERALEELLAHYRPEAIYERYSPFGAAGALLARARGIPHVLEVNAPLAWEGARYRGQALVEAAQELERAAFAATERIVAVSRELAESLQALGAPAEKIVVIPNGVDTDRFTPEGEVAGAFDRGTIVVGFVGSLKAWHGVDILLRAFRALAADPRFHLLVVGDGPQADQVDDLARELRGRVTRVGPLPHREVPRFVRAIDIAVAPYPPLDRFYYSPLKLLEYMAAGRAIVASRIGQIADLIEPERTGVLVEPGDVAALVATINELAANPNRRALLGRTAAQVARQRHRWTDRADQIANLIEEVTTCAVR